MFGTYRAILALMVVLLHLGGVPTIGAYAVFGFYTLSGYLMTLIMQRNYGYSATGVARYALNRVLRLFPAYWLSIIASVIVILVVGQDFARDFHPALYLPRTPSELLKNVFLFFPFRDMPRLTPPAWALTVELCFYLLIALGLSRHRRLVIAWLTGSVLYHAVVVAWGLAWPYRYFMIPAASLPFATGAFLYHFGDVLRRGIDRLGERVARWLPVLVVAAIFANWGAGYLSGRMEGLFFYTNYLLCALAVLSLAARRSLPLVDARVDRWLGDLSYPIYLIHYQVGLVVFAAFRLMDVEILRPDVRLLLVSLPLILVAAWTMDAIVEHPVQRLRSRVRTLGLSSV